MTTRARLQDGSVILEVIDHPENDEILLTISKERYDEDAVQVSISRPVAKALGVLLQGEER